MTTPKSILEKSLSEDVLQNVYEEIYNLLDRDDYTLSDALSYKQDYPSTYAQVKADLFCKHNDI